ncbi:MAG: 30S ribosomal protein S18 [Trueperaceae bacterium]|nr:30S ribosomal protein S18 [Truepera sp.]HRN17859.1 30S ribosomal protein S18 [Trueperaceae bacterium]HRQ11175.1 30S ribosomal protein S18 [Trueperaceae bacterium]
MAREARDKGGDRRRGRGGGRRGRRPRVCPFCAGEYEIMDYHDGRVLRRFISDTAKILPRRRTGVCARHQRRLATTIKRARMLAIIPITEKLVRK